MTTTIQVRIDAKMKKQAQSIFETMGLDLSSGVKMYLARVIQDKGLPFTPRTENGLTPEYEAILLREVAAAKKNGTGYRSAKAALNDIFD
jgi:DNA-damage-inducible protein J